MMRQRSNTSPILRLTRNLICIGIAAFLILFTQNEQFCKKIIPTANEQLETYSNIKQIAARLEEEILSGSGSFSFIRPGLTLHRSKTLIPISILLLALPTIRKQRTTVWHRKQRLKYNSNPLTMSMQRLCSTKPSPTTRQKQNVFIEW